MMFAWWRLQWAILTSDRSKSPCLQPGRAQPDRASHWAHSLHWPGLTPAHTAQTNHTLTILWCGSPVLSEEMPSSPVFFRQIVSYTPRRRVCDVLELSDTILMFHAKNCCNFVRFIDSFSRNSLTEDISGGKQAAQISRQYNCDAWQ